MEYISSFDPEQKPINRRKIMSSFNDQNNEITDAYFEACQDALEEANASWGQVSEDIGILIDTPNDISLGTLAEDVGDALADTYSSEVLCDPNVFEPDPWDIDPAGF